VSTFDFRSLLLLALFVIYGLGYVIVGLLNVQSPWAASFFKGNYSGQTLKVLFARDDPGKRCAICKFVPEFIEKNL
jgi:hypothetical protein